MGGLRAGRWERRGMPGAGRTKPSDSRGAGDGTTGAAEKIPARDHTRGMGLLEAQMPPVCPLGGRKRGMGLLRAQMPPEEAGWRAGHRVMAGPGGGPNVGLPQGMGLLEAQMPPAGLT